LWYIKFPIYGSAKKPLSIKKIKKVVWETLSRAHFANEKLAWGDQVATRESKSDEEFHTPTRSSMKEGTTTSPQPRPKVHLEVDSHVHSTIVKQLIEHIAISSSQEFASTKTTTKEKVKGFKRSTLT
jgi:hypothetical protein